MVAVTDAAPDVVLLDVHLPGVGVPRGIERRRRGDPRAPARGAGDALPGAQRSDWAEDVVGVIRAGARGYITKGSSGADVSRAVHAVADGDAVFSPKLAGFVLDAFGAAVGETASASDELDRLSAREQEVMRLIARGYAYKEVAAELFISTKTVETARVGGAAQAAALESARAHRVGERAPPAVARSSKRSPAVVSL